MAASQPSLPLSAEADLEISITDETFLFNELQPHFFIEDMHVFGVLIFLTMLDG